MQNPLSRRLPPGSQRREITALHSSYPLNCPSIALGSTIVGMTRRSFGILHEIIEGSMQTESVPATELLAQLPNEPGYARESKVLEFARAGYVPKFMCRWVPVPVTCPGHSGTMYVLPDYFCLGTDADFVRVRVNPVTAELICLEAGGCFLPTVQVVNTIYRYAQQKPVAQPWGPPYDHSMLLTQRWRVQDNKVAKTMSDHGWQPGPLTAGHMKDIVIGKGLACARGEIVGIFGWFDAKGVAIQGPTANWRDHKWTYADYAHGFRAVHPILQVDGQDRSIPEILQDSSLAPLLSAEGTLGHCCYLDFHPQTYTVEG
jgi:hypothetical protein